MVLIETYWNVNENAEKVENSTSAVLIETYWNVNECTRKEKCEEHGVLIETYWNVNPFYWWVLTKITNCINRNILECKSDTLSASVSCAACINRNILECK